MKKIYITIGVIIVIGIGYYLISPLFINIEINDKAPASINDDVLSGTELLTEKEKAQEEEMMKEANKTQAIKMEDELPVSNNSDRVFEVFGTSGHPAEGTVRLIETRDGTVIRYEDFETINGPKLHIYLAKDLRAKDFIDLGPVKGTSGNINYLVPKGVDLSEYKYVMYWCVPFKVLFNYADLSI